MIREFLIREYNNIENECAREVISRIFKEAYDLDIKNWEKE